MKIKTENPPCINCITLPICRALLIDKKETFTLRTLRLFKKCTMLSDYVHGKDDHLMLNRLNLAVIVITSEDIRIMSPYERKVY